MLMASTRIMLCIAITVPIGDSIRYNNIANQKNIGLSYLRSYSPEWKNIIEPFLDGGNFPDSIPILTQHPGVAIFDYDNDGDLDIFVSNGPGEPHSLFQNQFNNNNELQFIDVASEVGFGDQIAINHDGSGVCFGDIDNDNDNDLLILGRNDLNLLYLNNNGMFTLLSDSGISLQSKKYNSASCSWGDINSDGYIDVVIGNAADMTDMAAISRLSKINLEEDIDGELVDPFQYNQHNELYINNGGNGHSFTDISQRIVNTVFDDDNHNHTYNGIYNGKPTITWSIEMVDINADGFIDIVHADDNLGTLPPYGHPKGIIHIFINHGNGYFTDRPNFIPGYFMGIGAADLNCDANLDLFLSDYGGKTASRWYIGDGNGRFEPSDRKLWSRFPTDAWVSPFGWGNAIYDYDNDGDLDIIFHGGLDEPKRIIANNPGVIFENIDGCFTQYTVPQATQLFDIDTSCVDENNKQIEKCTIHVRRNVRGLAIGDLNMDGFYDIITTSDKYFGTDFPAPYLDFFASKKTSRSQLVTNNEYFQDSNFFWKSYIDVRKKISKPWRPRRGNLAVEIADKSDNNNNYFHVLIKGSKNLLDCGSVNRDAIGVLLNVNDINSITLPIEGGSSHLSQHSLQKIFGMGQNENANLLIKYPDKNGGYIVNKLNNIKPNENLILYEIPCDYNSKDKNLNDYIQCVEESLCILNKNKYINNELMNRLYNSALENDKQIVCTDSLLEQTFCHNNEGNAFKIPQTI